jgi:hypothetical protein
MGTPAALAMSLIETLGSDFPATLLPCSCTRVLHTCAEYRAFELCSSSRNPTPGGLTIVSDLPQQTHAMSGASFVRIGSGPPAGMCPRPHCHGFYRTSPGTPLPR